MTETAAHDQPAQRQEPPCGPQPRSASDASQAPA